MEYYEERGISPARKFFNTLSYVLNIVLLVCLLWCLKSTTKDNSNPTPTKEDTVNEEISIKERMASVIFEKEKAELPLKIQEYGSNGITIDSLVFTGENEGYLVSTWNGYKYDKRKKKVVYIKVRNIQKRGNEVRWQSDWHSAFTSLF